MPAAAPDPDLLARVVDVLAVAVVSEDLDGTITSWNAAAEQLYGLPASQAVGTPAAALVPEQDGGRQLAARAQARSGGSVPSVEAWHRRPDGRHVPVSLAVTALRGADGRITGLVTSTSDMSDRIRTDAELEDARHTLDRSVEALRRSNRDLEQFAYVASHDLSEPLRVMTGYVQLIEKRYGELLDERGRRYVFHVVDGSQRMRRLIDDLLEYSRFLRRPTTVGVVDTALLARDVVRRVAGHDAALQAGLVVADLPPVWSDESSVVAVLTNLVSNAVKFARPGQPPSVVVAGHREGGSVVLTVDDAGIGIGPEYRDRVFRMFSRLHLREEYEGTGIGLAIVQQVAESHGGSAWVEESALGGCRFCVRLPAAPVPGPRAAGDRATMRAGQPA